MHILTLLTRVFPIHSAQLSLGRLPTEKEACLPKAAEQRSGQNERGRAAKLPADQVQHHKTTDVPQGRLRRRRLAVRRRHAQEERRRGGARISRSRPLPGIHQVAGPGRRRRLLSEDARARSPVVGGRRALFRRAAGPAADDGGRGRAA